MRISAHEIFLFLPHYLCDSPRGKNCFSISLHLRDLPHPKKININTRLITYQCHYINGHNWLKSHVNDYFYQVYWLTSSTITVASVNVACWQVGPTLGIHTLPCDVSGRAARARNCCGLSTRSRSPSTSNRWLSTSTSARPWRKCPILASYSPSNSRVSAEHSPSTYHRHLLTDSGTILR